MSSELLIWLKEVALERAATEEFRVYWRRWEVHLMMLFSLSFQYFLLFSAHLRKKNIGGFFGLVSGMVYLTYLLADLVATVTLSALLRAQVDSDKSLVLLWTPFLLWHLGGPYNVTAYSLEDNNLWIRHMIGFAIHVSAFYICFNFGIHAHLALKFIAVPVLIAGVIKYLERIQALRSANEKRLVDQLFFGEGTVELEKQQQKIKQWGLRLQKYRFSGVRSESPLGFLRHAYMSFMIFRPLFFGLSARFCYKFVDKHILHDYIRQQNPEQAFKALEIELGLLYDSLYTKIPIQITRKGFFSHSLCFLFALVSLSAFSWMSARKHYSYGTSSVLLTYLLLLGAILLEVLSAVIRFYSTWSLGNPGEKMTDRLPLVRVRLRQLTTEKMTMSIGQHDLIEQYCFRCTASKPLRSLATNVDVNNTFRILLNSHWKVVDANLKATIHSHVVILRTNSRSLFDDSLSTDDIPRHVLKNNHLQLQEAAHWRSDAFAGFIEFLFVFHLATNILYYTEIRKYSLDFLGKQSCITSKRLSDYMMYLALVRPSMLPKGLTDLINKDTHNQSRVITGARYKTLAKFSEALYSMDSLADVEHPAVVMNNLEKLYNSTAICTAICLSRSLTDLTANRLFDCEERWDLICNVWKDLLVIAAYRCSWKDHVQQLKEGGELLTYVALLLERIGILRD